MTASASPIEGAAVLLFAPHVRFRFDERRKAWIVLAPERLLLPDEQAVAILRLIDGKRDVDAIIDELAGQFDALRDVIASDDVQIYRGLAGGVTTSRLLHGSANCIGGQDAVIKMKYQPLTPEDIEEWNKAQEEEGEKPDPNNLYFTDKIFGGVVPKEYIPSVEQGFRESTVKGAKYGFQCVDIQ